MLDQLAMFATDDLVVESAPITDETQRHYPGGPPIDGRGAWLGACVVCGGGMTGDKDETLASIHSSANQVTGWAHSDCWFADENTAVRNQHYVDMMRKHRGPDWMPHDPRLCVGVK